MALTAISRAVGVSTLTLMLSTSCSASDTLPGTALGTFAITAVLSSNTCGSGLKPENPWKFDAEMSLDGSTLYFRPDNQDELSAPLDSENTATFTSIANSGASNDSACSISLKSIYTVQLDSATAPTTSSGSLRFEYSASGTNTCMSQLSANGGTYDELPCAVVFSYTGLKK